MTQMLQNASAEDRPSVVSMSYGWSESEQCGGTVNAPCRAMGLSNNQYINRTNFELQKVGLLGITMLARCSSLSSSPTHPSNQHATRCHTPCWRGALV
jgi:hypothetical protein